MKILLISPPTISAIKHVVGVTGPPLGLAYLASIARERGHVVKIIDSLASNLSFSDVRNEIKAYDPELIGLTPTTSMMPDAYNVADTARSINPDVKIAIGGPHVTFAPDITMTENRSIDYVIRGEGELVFANLLDHLSGKKEVKEIRGLSYRASDKIVNNAPEILIPDVDSIPLPALDLLPMQEYRIDDKSFGTIMTSRGCPYNCIFCSSSLQFGKQWRGHSVDRVISELRRLVDKYNKKEIEFLDDTFTLNMKRAIEISNRIKSEKLDIHYSASARVNLFNDEIAAAIKSSGAHTIYFGIESGNQKTLDFIGKSITLDQSVTAVKKARKVGLNTLGSFIIGFPEDTVKDVKNTIKFSKRLNVTVVQFTIATPYPGTRLWDYVMQRNLLLSRNWRDFTTLSPVIKLKNFSSETILKWLGYAYVSFYLRPTFLLKDLVKDHGFIFKRLIPYSKSFLSMNGDTDA